MDEKGKQIKIRDKIVKQCKVMADDWAEIVVVVVVCPLQPSSSVNSG